MLDKIGNMFDPGKLLNNMLDQMLPGKLGNMLGDVAGMALDGAMGNYMGALSNFNDFFSNISSMFQGGMQDFIGSMGSQIPEPGTAPSISDSGVLDPQGHLAVDGNKITTPGGYTVEATGKNSEWLVTSPNGEQTRIWGDPHVDTKDGPRWDWDDKSMSFVLPDGTKISANATNALGVTTDFNVYYGNERVEVTGVNTANPKTSTVSYDAAVHDKFHDDGSTVFLGGTGNDWFKMSPDGVLKEITGGGGHHDLTLGKEFWIDASIQQAAQLTGMPYMGDNPQLQGQQGQPGQVQGQPMNLMDLINRLSDMLLGAVGGAGGAGEVQGAGGAGGAGGAQGAGEAQGAEKPFLSLQDMQESQDKDDVKNIIARAKSGTLNLEDALFTLMSKLIENQQKKVLDKAGKIDQAGDKGASQTDTVELQMAMNRLQRMFETLSQAMKALHDAAMTAARNVK